MTAPKPTPALSPSPYASQGLLQAHFDCLGNGWLEDVYRGNLDSAVYTVTANTITIPQNVFGGAVTWVRGAWLATATFRWNGFMADLSPSSPSTTNYFVSAVNNPTNTVITLSGGLANGTIVQVYYIYRTGQRTKKGQALGGWPNLHLADAGLDYGTANDGDNYLARSLYYAYNATGLLKYKALADRIISAQLLAGTPQGQTLTFDIPFTSQKSGSGLYNYYGNGATWSWGTVPVPDGSMPGNCLFVSANLSSGGGAYGGWGWWPSWPVTRQTSVNGVSFDFWGDGSLNQIQVGTKDQNNNSYVYGYACLLGDAGKVRVFSPSMNDFWSIANVIYNGDRVGKGYAYFGNGAKASLTNFVEDNTSPSGFHQFIDNQFIWDSTAGGTAYAGFNYTGTWIYSNPIALNFDLYCNVGVNIAISVKDANGNWFDYYQNGGATPGYATTPGAALVSLPWTTMVAGTPTSQWKPETSGTLTHPIQKVQFQPASGTAGTLRINSVRVSTTANQFNVASGIDTFNSASPAPTIFNGLAFALQSYGSYNVYWKNVQILQQSTNPYPMISRWGYDWYYSNGVYGQGAYRGPQAPGYMYLGGYEQNLRTFPAGTYANYPQGAGAAGSGASLIDYSNQPIANVQRQFMLDAQQAYKTQFPSQAIGPTMPNYGCWGWEALNTPGYVAPTTLAANTLNQWYFDSGGDWYGYFYRAFLSVAEDYYLSGGNATSGAFLNNVMSWITATMSYNSTTNTVTLPTTFNQDGTLATSASNCYVDALMAQVCIYKYWVDGDTVALTWCRRFLDDLHYNCKQTTAGKILGQAFMTNQGSGYTTAGATISDPTGNLAGVSATCNVAGGKVTHILINPNGPYGLNGSGCTNPMITITGDGAGATATLALSDKLYGAYSTNHAGWEISECANAFGMLVNGRLGGTVNHPIAIGPNDLQDFNDVWTFYQNNINAAAPSILNNDWTPVHEYLHMSPWHWNSGIENPATRDTHTDGDCWTETLGPTLFYAVEYYRKNGDNSFLEVMYSLIEELSGATNFAPFTALMSKPNTHKVTLAEITLGERLTSGWQVVTPTISSIPGYLYETISQTNGKKSKIAKQITSILANGITLAPMTNYQGVANTYNSFWHDVLGTSNSGVPILYINVTATLPLEGYGLDYGNFYGGISSVASTSVIMAYFTLYLSSEGKNFNGNFYEPYIAGSFPVQQNAMNILAGYLSISDGQFLLSNADGFFDVMLQKFVWENGNINVLVGGGDAGYPYSNFVKTFGGRVINTRWELNKVTLTIRDPLMNLTKLVPYQNYSANQYPYMASATGRPTFGGGATDSPQLGKPIPIAYGYFDANAAPTLTAIDETLYSSSPWYAVRFKIAGHEIASVANVYISQDNGNTWGAALAHDTLSQYPNAPATSNCYNVNLQLAEISVNFGLGNYDPAKTQAKAVFYGKPTSSGAGVAITLPATIVQDLLISYGGMTANEFNVAAFALSGSVSSAAISFYLNTATRLTDVINKICTSDLAFFFQDVNGLLNYVCWQPTKVSSSALTIGPEEVLSIRTDFLQTQHFTSVSVGYGHTVKNGLRRYLYQSIDQKNVYEWDTLKNVDTYLTYQADAIVLAERLGSIQSVPLGHVYLKTTWTAAAVNVGDMVNLNLNRAPTLAGNFSGTLYQVQSAGRDYMAGTTDLVLTNMNSAGLTVGAWTADTAGVWNAGGGPADKATSGYWCDDNGYALATDPSSYNISDWW